MLILRITSFALVLSWLPTGANSQNFSDEQDPRGAVMCVWLLYNSLHLIGTECRPEAKNYIDTLKAAIDRLDAYIYRNSGATAEQLEGMRSKKRLFPSYMPICDPAGENLKIYNLFVERMGEDKLMSDLDELLEVDRPPAFNPCF